MLPLTGYALPASAIQDIVNHASGVSRITPRLSLCDKTLQPIQLSQAGLTGDFSDITRACEGVTVANSTTSAVMRSLAFKFHPGVIPGLDFNTLGHYVRVYVDFWDGNDRLLFDVPKGVFRAVLPDRDLQSSGEVWTLTALDPTQAVARLPFVNTYTWPVGTLYTDVARAILTADSSPLSQGGNGQTPVGLDHVGPGFSASRLNITPSTLALPSPLQATPKDNQLTFLNDQVLAPINYRPLWADSYGTVQVGPIPINSAGVPVAGWTYITDSTSIIQPPISQRFADQTQLFNLVKIIVEPSSGNAFSATAYNTSPGSAISGPNMGGEWWPEVIEDPQIPDQATANARATVELQMAATQAETLSFATTINPFHECFDYIDFSVVYGDTTYVSSASFPFLETAWSMDFSQGGGTMSHTLGKTVQI
jgi:hypothetical protein